MLLTSSKGQGVVEDSIVPRVSCVVATTLLDLKIASLLPAGQNWSTPRMSRCSGSGSAFFARLLRYPFKQATPGSVEAARHRAD